MTAEEREHNIFDSHNYTNEVYKGENDKLRDELWMRKSRKDKIFRLKRKQNS